MITKKLASRVGVAAAVAALSLSGLAGQASAASANIDSWTSQANCDLGSPNFFCLYFSPNHSGPVKHYSVDAVPTISDFFPGTTQLVRNNAASVDNGTVCHVGIWVNTGFTGDSNFLVKSNHGGNLTESNPRLRNNEASIGVDDATNCPGIGVLRFR